MANCTLCNFKVTEKAHVISHATFVKDESYNKDKHHIANLIPLCPSCHTLFDSKIISVHPKHRILIFSQLPSVNNIFLNEGIGYSMNWFTLPHGNVLKDIPKTYLKWNIVNEFRQSSESWYIDYFEKHYDPKDTRRLEMRYVIKG